MSIDWDKPLRTKSGLPARLVTDKATDTEYRHHGVLVEGKEFDAYIIYKNNGSYQLCPHELDLENIPEKIVRYISVYPDGYMTFHETRKDSDAGAHSSRIACIRVEAEEGQYDD